MTDQPTIRPGNRNPRNLYSGPDAADHFAVVVGDLDHAAAVSGWLIEAARAHIAAGHPMPRAAVVDRDQVIDQAACVLREADGFAIHDDAPCYRVWARKLADAGLLAERDALQGDQAADEHEEVSDVSFAARKNTEPERDIRMTHYVYEMGGGICYGPGGTCTAETWHVSGCPRSPQTVAAEPAVTPPDPSGRIRDNGLVEPFRPDDTEVPGA